MTKSEQGHGVGTPRHLIGDVLQHFEELAVSVFRRRGFPFEVRSDAKRTDSGWTGEHYPRYEFKLHDLFHYLEDNEARKNDKDWYIVATAVLTLDECWEGYRMSQYNEQIAAHLMYIAALSPFAPTAKFLSAESHREVGKKRSVKRYGELKQWCIDSAAEIWESVPTDDEPHRLGQLSQLLSTDAKNAGFTKVTPQTIRRWLLAAEQEGLLEIPTQARASGRPKSR